MLALCYTTLDMSRIAPANGLKFSPNLYRWLRSERNRNTARLIRVYRDDTDTLWIGMLDGRELIGARLVSVLCNGANQNTSAWQGIDATEILDFWNNYMRIGRCAIDTKHVEIFWDDERRWQENGDSRACKWCGVAAQTMKRWEEVVQRSQWVTL